MGLAGRKVKQRIPNDPRNLAWANDANKFGAAYLAKLGWDPSQGLGVSGEGRTKAISVTQKLDMLGIGADHRNSQEGIAWKQNKDFENLLKRLNAANGTAQAEEEPERMKVDGFVRAGPDAGAGTVPEERATSEDVEPAVEGEVEEKRSKKKRRKCEDEEDKDGRKKKRKKSKSSEDQSDAETEKKDKKKKKKRDASEDVSPASSSKVETSVPAAATPATQAVAPVKTKAPRLHRARHMAAKNLASKSALAIAEILGIAPDPTPSGSATPSLAPTPNSGFSSSAAPASTPYPPTAYEPGPSTSNSGSSGSATPADQLKLQELTVSSKSVMDYFKEKLAAKSNSRLSSAGPSTPAAQQQDEVLDDYAERPRIGLGASRLRVETKFEEEVQVERGGLGGIGSGARSQFASMFAKASTTVTNTTEVVTTETATVVKEEATSHDPSLPKKSKETKDKERKKEKKDKKGKSKAKEETEQGEELSGTPAEVAEDADEKAERKRRKEEKRRRKEAEAATRATEESAADAASDSERKERKRKKDKKKSKS
ncbi:hypothetical protein BV20DRAFT_953190 [Pilatotrama ljubarskyi]|nr:hypothetical protein BV20DRAFT_953190 [Pilatotrama ljubarskyi]